MRRNVFRSVLLTSVGLLALNGCLATTKSVDKKTVPVAATWQNNLTGGSAVVAPDSQWWTNFNDATLNALISQAAQNNVDIQLAASRLRQVRAEYLAVQADLSPDIKAVGNVGRNKTSREVGGGVGGTNNLYDMRLDASWEFNIFGIDAALSAADAQIKAVAEDANGVKISLLAEVARHYLELRRNQALLQKTNATIESLQSILDLTQARLDAGLVNELDRTRAIAQLKASTAQRPQYQAAVQASQRRIEVLAGQVPGSLNAVLQDKGALPRLAVDPALAAPASVMAARPDIRVAEANLNAAAARVRVETARQYPSLNLGSFFGWQANKTGNFFDPAARIWSLAAGFTQPVFDFGRIQAAIDIADEKQQQAFLVYQKTILESLEDVENAVSNYISQQNRFQELNAAVVASTKALALANDRHAAGLTSFLDVLSAQSTLYQNEQAAIEAEAQILLNAVQLYKALGGGWQANTAAAIAAPITPVVSDMPAAMTPASPAAAPGKTSAGLPEFEVNLD